ncbi:MAG: hypothetical protein KUG83_05620 [Gammaproteobacteria bacterium]|nr:hypothetical protein [Gammaproteobacteria bacterium]
MYIDRLLILLIIGAYLITPIITHWWTEGGTAWYRPYLIWAGLIATSFWITRSRDLDEF